MFKKSKQKASEREIVHHRRIFYYKRQSKKCIKLEIDVFQAPTGLHSVNNSVISSHCISRFCYRTRSGKQKNPRQGITFEESFLRNEKKGGAQRSDFAIHPCYLSPNDRKRRLRWSRLAGCQSHFRRHLACRRPRLVRQSTITSEKQRRHAVAKGGLLAGDTRRREGGRVWRCAERAREKGENGTRNGSPPRAKSNELPSSALVFVRVFIRVLPGAETAEYWFHPRPPSSTLLSPSVPRPFAPPLPLLQHFPTDTVVGAATSPLSVPFSLSLSLPTTPISLEPLVIATLPTRAGSSHRIHLDPHS